MPGMVLPTAALSAAGAQPRAAWRSARCRRLPRQGGIAFSSFLRWPIATPSFSRSGSASSEQHPHDQSRWLQTRRHSAPAPNPADKRRYPPRPSQGNGGCNTDATRMAVPRPQTRSRLLHLDDRFGSRPAYRGLPMAGPLYGLQRSKRGRMSGLSRIPVVLRPGSEGQSLAMCGRLSVGKGCLGVLRG